MREKEFHKKIEELLTEEEKVKKGKTLGKIAQETAYRPTYKQKRISIKWVSIAATCLVLVMVLASVLLINYKNNITAFGGQSSPSSDKHQELVNSATDTATNTAPMDTAPMDTAPDISDNSEPGTGDNTAPNAPTYSVTDGGLPPTSDGVLVYAANTAEGNIVARNNELYFTNSDGSIYTKINTSSLVLRVQYETDHVYNPENNYHDSKYAGDASIEDLTDGMRVCVDIIIKVYLNEPNYKVGDIVTIRIIKK